MNWEAFASNPQAGEILDLLSAVLEECHIEKVQLFDDDERVRRLVIRQLPDGVELFSVPMAEVESIANAMIEKSQSEVH